MLLSAADGIVGKNRTPKRGGEHDKSEISSCTACWRTSRGLEIAIDCLPHIGAKGVVLPALDLDNLNVDVLAVVAEADESLRELDKFESCDVFLVINHDECLRRGSNIRNGIPQ
jgi:hypothetical protein